MYGDHVQRTVESERFPSELTACGSDVQGRDGVVAVGLTAPAEVHVEPVFAVEAVADPRMAASAAGRHPRHIERETVSDFLFQYLHEVGSPLVRPPYEGGIVIEIVAQSPLCQIVLCAA